MPELRIPGLSTGEELVDFQEWISRSSSAGPKDLQSTRADLSSLPAPQRCRLLADATILRQETDRAEIRLPELEEEQRPNWKNALSRADREQFPGSAKLAKQWVIRNQQADRMDRLRRGR